MIVVEGMGKRNPHQVASRQEPGKGLLCYIAKLALVISNSRFLFNKVDYRGRNKRDLIGKKRFKRGIQQKMN